jgi:hypothetical protein
MAPSIVRPPAQLMTGQKHHAMNQTSDSDIERLLAEHGPRRPPAFAALHPLAEFIRELRKRGASFEIVRGILRAQSIDVIASTVRRFAGAFAT